MRSAAVFVAVAVLAGALSACASIVGRSHDEAGEPNSGVTGAIIKRPAVQDPNSLDLGNGIESVEDYDLDTQSAGMNKTVGSVDAERDREIDSIVNTITAEPPKTSAAPAATTPKASAKPGVKRRRRPAVPAVQPLSNAEPSGVTAGTRAPTRESEVTLPPLPARAGVSDAAEQQALKEHEAKVIAKPLWRRVHDQEIANDPAHESSPRGF
jgi:hypothetical protein